MKSTLSLYNAVKNQYGHISFHTPGHKFHCPEIEALATADTTEISVTDELYHPFGPILTAEGEAAEIFGVKNVCFSAGGATLCIQTALSFYAGKKVLTERSCHISVINASALLGIDLDFMWGKTHETFGFSLPVTPKDIEDHIRDGQYSAVVVTSPNYYGLCADIKGIREVCDRWGCDLITDNSHGSHLPLMYPDDGHRNAVKHSHFSISSLHKTLPVMTGGAMLCANKSITKEQIKAKMAMFGSTSPSFPVLASVDFGISYIANNVSEYKKTAENVTLLAKKLRACGFYVQDNSEEESLRLCIDTFSIGYSAEETEEYLSQKSIFPEIAQNNRLLFLFSPFNKENEYEALFSALSSMEKRDPIKTQFKDTHVRPQRKISLRDALLYPTESIPTSKAVGRISAETFATCPPGMAIVVSGEEINEDTARILAKHKKQTEVVK